MSRYIDADKLHYTRIRIIHEDETIGGYNAVVMSAEIYNAPTADVEEVKHGKYINDNGTKIMLYTAECSCCNEITAMGLYCMWCGAKMDKEEEEKTTVCCKECKYLEISGCYGECGKAYRGIVYPDDSCGYGERKDKKEKEE